MGEVLIIDFETSGIGPQAFPIEVAWSVPGSDLVVSTLIRPYARWLTPGSWEPRSAAVHRIPPAEIKGNGRHPAQVAAAFRKASAGRTVLSDGIPLDARMLRMLLDDTAPPLTDFWETAMRRGDRETIKRAVNEVDLLHPQRHRAAADVQRLCFLWERITGRGSPHPAQLASSSPS